MGENSTEFSKNDNNFESWNSNGDISSTTDTIMATTDVGAQKRPFTAGEKYGEPPAKRSVPSIHLDAGFKWNLQALGNAADAVQTGGKSPVSALNELGVRVNYTVLQQGGPPHCPSFTVAVTVANMTFQGWGHSKREARAAAARSCLTALLARAGRVLPYPAGNQDFTSDDPAKYSEFQCLESKFTHGKSKPPMAPPAPAPPSLPPSPAARLFGSTAISPAHKSPINLLYENHPGLTFVCTYGDGTPLDAAQAPAQLSHSMRFKVVCQIKDQKFEGYGSSKKLAKLAAARSALAVVEEGHTEPMLTPAPSGYLPQTLADHVAKLVNEKFTEVMKDDAVHSKRKVLAGIVITVNNQVKGAKVIAVTTGTKCVSGEHISVRGRALNDCHAEVAARRCLQRHLYAQLLTYAQSPDPKKTIPNSDIEPVPGGGYQLKPDRQVHLYVSTAPCGDGRIFSPHEQNELEPDKHPNRLARGQLRTKIESGEGTIPVKNCSNIVQTWDGVMQGERLVTMSCSDKVARWCVLGLQGALLSRVLRPVYLSSLVLGSLLHPHHMYRAICGRIEAYISSLPPPYQLNRPMLARAASTEARTPARAPSFSVCWSHTTPIPEIVNATTGKLESGQPSLLCKQTMFARWQHLVNKLPQLPQEPEFRKMSPPVPANMENLLYNEAKQMCPEYQVAKQRLFEAFEKAKLGRWIKKPLEQDQFVCEIVNADPNVLFAWACQRPYSCTAQDDINTIVEKEFDEKHINKHICDDFNNVQDINDTNNKNNDVSDDNHLKVNLDRLSHRSGAGNSKENINKIYLNKVNRCRVKDFLDNLKNIDGKVENNVLGKLFDENHNKNNISIDNGLNSKTNYGGNRPDDNNRTLKDFNNSDDIEHKHSFSSKIQRLLEIKQMVENKKLANEKKCVEIAEENLNVILKTDNLIHESVLDSKPRLVSMTENKLKPSQTKEDFTLNVTTKMIEGDKISATVNIKNSLLQRRIAIYDKIRLQPT